ncbi:putative BPI/LBP family protein At1g04970 [Humulus lupulus]|uniref:putative BPI/LBP family protein At1g04970 n=1 Tax=Humulus lupulus TaxID=3486 RepID=UPI002B408950|nr:putative BPI/LBP family protein At1g04970 [Humulus lupulus]
MGFFSKFMAIKFVSLFLWLLLLIPSSFEEEGFVSVVISDKGLDFSKDLLIEKAINSIIPLHLPLIEKYVQVPLIGKVHVVLSNITIYSVDVPSSYVETGEMGIAIIASGATAKLSMNWKYSYSSWFFEISDDGRASIQVEGMDVGATVALEDQEGSLKLSILESGCYVKDISIKVDGGASWLYQGLVDAFQGNIESLVEDAISKKIGEGIARLNSLLQSLPKQIAVYDIAAMNVTFVGKPVLSSSSTEFEINGLFMAIDDLTSRLYHKNLVDRVSCNASSKMIEISLHEKVFNSVSLLFFNAGYMHWIVDKVPDQSLLNTSKWKYAVPQLYKKYPNHPMDLNISVSSPPIVKVKNNDIETTIYSAVIINVLDAAEVIPVVCMSLEIAGSCSPKIVENRLVGTLKLKDFTTVLKWSEIGDLHMHLVQSVMSALLKTVVIPYVNLHLWKGMPLPIFCGFMLQNAEVSCMNDTKLVICSDVTFTEQWQLGRQFV